jgi:HlyD family secretion protein
MKIIEILKNKKYLAIIVVIAVIVVGFVVYNFVFSNKNQNQNVFVVQKAGIVQEVTVTGQVRKGDKINLAFLNSGRLRSVFVKVGDKVEKGNVLARLDVRDLEIQLEEAKAGLILAESKLEKLLAGKT